METLSRVGCLTNCTHFPFPTSSPIYPPQSHSTRLPSLSVLRTPRPVGELAGEDVLRMFFKERELNGDFISKASDMLWQREVMKFVDAEAGTPPDTPQQPEGVKETEYEGGFLKLTRTQEWVLGDNSAPINKKAIAKVLQDDSERRKRLNLLKYEALKREILLLSVSIGTACSGYCLIVLSAQAAISYAAGVLFSCLYLQLLYQHADNLSKEAVPQIFMKKKSKKIGIRSQDLEDLLEKTIKGSGIALSSPRLVIPAAIYGLWILSQHFAGDFFDFQLVPAMFGMFAYKAAALVQVYRDNEDLQFVFPDNEEGSID
ncbi:uncharacterized protein LOC117915636 isoform X1 [Vitis riparia]|uniref:uncharacterized protein LOC117915636 isoform X1 n=1 Tax=Vitis riparia TaxID=96939 RepID=UPI00155AAA6D|nr:uncharacterized protein LOC117915636 isoform X1 [Vitis riparia]